MAQNSAEKERAPSSKTEEKSPREEETTALVKEENEEKSPEEQERIDKILSSMRRLSSTYSETELLRLLEDYIGECMVCMGYKENRRFSNIRLLLASLACCIAFYASFFIPFPVQGHHLQLSIVCFFGALFVLLLVEVFVVKNAIGCFKDKQEKSFFMDCHVDRETNDLVFAVRQGKELQISSAASLGQFFDSKGYMLIDVIFEHVRQLLGRYEEESVLFDASEKKQQKQQQATQKASGGPSSGRGSKIAVKSKGSSSSGKKSS